MNTIIGFSELLRDQDFGPLNEKQARFLDSIRKAAQHLLALVSDLLDLSAVEAGRLQLRPAPLDLHEVLESTAQDLRPQAEANGLGVELRLDPAPCMLIADPVRIKQILCNLLSNAIKFTPNGGRITVTARRIAGHPGGTRSQIADLETSDRSPKSAIANLQSEIGDFLEIAVADTGIGIRAEDLPRLFRPFTRLEPTGTKRTRGTGLGLALTRRLVELHGGSIRAESRGGRPREHLHGRPAACRPRG